MSRWLIERAGIQITVKTKSDAAAELIQSALAGMRPEQVNQVQGIKLTVGEYEKGLTLRDHTTGLKRKLVNPGDLIYHLTDRIVFHIADNAEDSHCLHAGAVSFGDNALVIPANSGAGKSSFTTWLVANGFAYLTDELILIDADHRISGLARPIQIKSHGLEAIKPLLTNPDLMFSGNLVNAVRVEALDGQVSEYDSHRLAMFVFPQYSKEADFSFKRLSSAEAGMSLMGNHVNARNLEGHGFREMMAIIRKTPCYSLEYGGFDKLPTSFSAQLEAVLSAEDV